MRELGYELYDRQIKLHVEQIEGIVLAKRPDITSRLFNDVLRFTDALLQTLDRKIEGLRARHGNELREVRDEIVGLREQIAALREQVTALQAVVGQPPAPRAAPDVSPTGFIVD
jgi:hypothetical protein